MLPRNGIYRCTLPPPAAVSCSDLQLFVRLQSVIDQTFWLLKTLLCAVVLLTVNLHNDDADDDDDDDNDDDDEYIAHCICDAVVGHTPRTIYK